jgi:hypothetical protein
MFYVYTYGIVKENTYDYLVNIRDHLILKDNPPPHKGYFIWFEFLALVGAGNIPGVRKGYVSLRYQRVYFLIKYPSTTDMSFTECKVLNQ